MNFDWNLIKPGWDSILITVVGCIMLCGMVIGCKRSEPESRAVNNNYWYIIAKIEGHDYVISGVYGCYGVGVTHSESCLCKKGIK